jgi:hypothetical protein
MRKIEQEMCYAIRNKIAWSKSNTCTTFSDQGKPYCDTLVYLHGNLIAKINDTYVYLFDGGWQSNTTKSRLNAILSEVHPSCKVYQKNFDWFVKLSSGESIPFYSGIELNFPDINSYSQSNLAALSNTEWGKSHLEVITV